MKIFNTVQELWTHCVFCPLCKQYGRTLALSAGPDDQFRFTQNMPYELSGHELKLNTVFDNHARKSKVPGSPKNAVSYTIDMESNTFTIDIHSQSPLVVEDAEKANFYFYIYANCNNCNSSYFNSADLEFDLLEKKVCNLQADREGFYLTSEKDKYHITASHDKNILMVSRLEIAEDGIVSDGESIVELPFINLDFSDLTKVSNKIKTLILFS